MYRYTPFIVTGFISLLLFSCSDTDTTKPLTELIYPSEMDAFSLIDTIVIKATFYDDNELKQYRIEVKNNFTEYPDSIIGWNMILADTIAGTEETIGLQLVIPDTISDGSYYVMAKCIDIDGNESPADTSRIIVQ